VVKKPHFIRSVLSFSQKIVKYFVNFFLLFVLSARNRIFRSKGDFYFHFCILFIFISIFNLLKIAANGRVHIRHQCRKTTVLSCHRCLSKTGVEKNEQHLNIDNNFDHQMSVSKCKCWYSNNCLQF
jgi:hypothetical protein